MAAEVTIDVVARDSFSGVLGNFGNVITGIKSAVDLVAGAFEAFGDFAMEGLDAVASYERLTLALTSLNAAQMVQAGTAENVAAAMDVAGVKAEELAEWMQELAIRSPFTLEGVANAFRTAQAYGFTADEAQRLTQALIDFSAGTGATEYSMQRITLALGQISTIGKLTGQDMMQLTQAGLPVAQILADAFGVTTAEIIEMRTAGLIPAQDAIEAITVWMETNFSGAAANFANSWAGITSTFEDIKQMGLREFFAGVFDAVQPLVVAFAEWAQGPGIEFLGALGDAFGEFINSTIGDLERYAPLLSTLNLAFMEFTNLLQNDWSPLQALQKVLSDLAIVWEDEPLGDVIARLQEFIETADQEGLVVAFQDLFSDVFDNVDAAGAVQSLLDKLATLLGAADWREIGELIGQVLSDSIRLVFESMDAIVEEVDWRPFGNALKGAIKEVIQGAFQDTDLTDTMSEFGADLFNISLFSPAQAQVLGTLLAQRFFEIGHNIGQGLLDGFLQANVDFTAWWDEHLVQPVRRFLGIASPSTVFMDIGRNIVLGLIVGIGSMFVPLATLANTIVENLKKIFDPVLDLFGLGGSTSGGLGGASAEVPAGTLGTSGSGGVLNTAGSVTNVYNIYGTSYWQGAGPEGTFDCAYPNPIMTGSTGTIGGHVVVR